MLRPVARVIIAAALLLAACAIAAQARPRIRRDFVATYPKTQGTKLDACVTCHATEDDTLNPYGEALKQATFDFKAIEKLDSDGDGVANRAEIDSLTFPGDPEDRPGARRDSTRADSTRHAPSRSDSATVKPKGEARPDTIKAPKNG
ncbi:MAG: hypothetical protein HY076_05025 [Candidatus Eisenbacteria bacterium]|uniref:EF-hand domain-containing protein n=1 Tax=Eiseniibacteriota bacterium TaxID=2212470 RepID=A0A9D6L844_UNCEI|nr:hypothetical protein [Candidatus Eisenbacteria bacterium]MBI3539614.1 hypothetical protein [Candidatus Eisenbacteria bacterium]